MINSWLLYSAFSFFTDIKKQALGSISNYRGNSPGLSFSFKKINRVPMEPFIYWAQTSLIIPFYLRQLKVNLEYTVSLKWFLVLVLLTKNSLSNICYLLSAMYKLNQIAQGYFLPCMNWKKRDDHLDKYFFILLT